MILQNEIWVEMHKADMQVVLIWMDMNASFLHRVRFYSTFAQKQKVYDILCTMRGNDNYIFYEFNEQMSFS